jgi:hypothetical protein
VAELYPRSLSSLYVASYYLQDYGGNILILPQPGGPARASSPYILYILQQQDGPVQSQSHVTTDDQSISMSWCRVQAALEGLYFNEF